VVLHELNELTFSFGRRIPSARRHFFVWPAHSISVPPFLYSAGAFHHRTAVSFRSAGASHHHAAFSFVCRRIRRGSTDLVLLFGWRIPSKRRILFRLLVHSPPIHRFGVAVRLAHLIAMPSFAGAFAADPPIWCCSVWPAHSPPIHQFGVVSFGRRIPHPAATNLALFHMAGAFPADSVSSFAGAFAANPPIWCCSIWLAHPLAGPPLPIFGRRIPSLRHLCLSRLAHPIAHFSPAHPLAVPPLPT